MFLPTKFRLALIFEAPVNWIAWPAFPNLNLPGSYGPYIGRETSTIETLTKPGKLKTRKNTIGSHQACQIPLSAPESLGTATTCCPPRMFRRKVCRADGLDCRRPWQRSVTGGFKTTICSQTTWRLPLSSCETPKVHVPEQQGERFPGHMSGWVYWLPCLSHPHQSTSCPSLQPSVGSLTQLLWAGYRFQNLVFGLICANRTSVGMAPTSKVCLKRGRTKSIWPPRMLGG